jgi:hypothetical protein
LDRISVEAYFLTMAASPPSSDVHEPRGHRKCLDLAQPAYEWVSTGENLVHHFQLDEAQRVPGITGGLSSRAGGEIRPTIGLPKIGSMAPSPVDARHVSETRAIHTALAALRSLRKVVAVIRGPPLDSFPGPGPSQV